MGLWDDYDYDPSDEQPATECKYCGKAGLTWEDDNGRWVLLGANGARHKCDPAKFAKLAGDDFEDLTK